MSDMKCPFCKEELSYAQEIDGGFEILTCDCPYGIWLFGNDKMWYNLEKVITELERTRKALDVKEKQVEISKKALSFINENWNNADCGRKELGACAFNAIEDISAWEEDIAEIKQITALEQKDVK